MVMLCRPRFGSFEAGLRDIGYEHLDDTDVLSKNGIRISPGEVTAATALCHSDTELREFRRPLKKALVYCC